MTGSGRVALEVESLTKTFRERGSKEVRAVDGASFQVKQGEIVGILGPNGAGKTTLIKCTLGLLRPNAGHCAIFGQDLATGYPGMLRHVSAVLEGSRNLYWRLTVWENILFYAGIHGISVEEGRQRFEHLIRMFDLEDKRDVEVRKLSQGMKQKAAVVCALARDTPLVFLDEPTLGLDVETSLELRHLLKRLAREEDRTIVLSSHDMDVVQDVCERVIIMSSGRIIADDSVHHLIELFRTRAYRIVLRGHAPDGLEARLGARFPGVLLKSSERMCELRLGLPEPDDIYQLMDVLRDARASIDEISQEEPDLERIFLEIVRRERACQCH